MSSGSSESKSISAGIYLLDWVTIQEVSLRTKTCYWHINADKTDSVFQWGLQGTAFKKKIVLSSPAFVSKVVL